MRAAVLGRPVAHSLSPVMHRAAYAALGLTDWRYEALETGEDDVADFVRSCGPQWAGLSLTMPLKRAVREVLVSESALATEVGAVNTAIRRDDGWHGYNTDVHGIVMALREAGLDDGRPDGAGSNGAGPDGAGSNGAGSNGAGPDGAGRGVVLGGGATAASALAALRELGCRRTVVAVRSPARSGPLLQAAQRLAVEVELTDLAEGARAAVAALDHTGAVVSTVPAEVAADLAPALVAAGPGRGPAPTDRPGPVLLDVVYDPWPTPLAQAWAGAGGRCAGGFAMLVHQAEGQVRLMTGHRVDVEVLRAAGSAELERRARVPG